MYVNCPLLRQVDHAEYCKYSEYLHAHFHHRRSCRFYLIMLMYANVLRHGVYHRRLGHVGLSIIALAKRPPIDRSATPTKK